MCLSPSHSASQPLPQPNSAQKTLYFMNLKLVFECIGHKKETQKTPSKTPQSFHVSCFIMFSPSFFPPFFPSNFIGASPGVLVGSQQVRYAASSYALKAWRWEPNFCVANLYRDQDGGGSIWPGWGICINLQWDAMGFDGFDGFCGNIMEYLWDIYQLTMGFNGISRGI